MRPGPCGAATDASSLPDECFGQADRDPVFTESFDGDLSAEKIEAMDDRVFEQYAFSWRGRKVITDNIRRIRALAMSDCALLIR